MWFVSGVVNVFFTLLLTWLRLLPNTQMNYNELKTRTPREIIDVANGNAVEEKAFRRVESGSPESVLNYKKLYECV